MNSLWDIRIFLGLVPKESPCIWQFYQAVKLKDETGNSRCRRGKVLLARWTTLLQNSNSCWKTFNALTRLLSSQSLSTLINSFALVTNSHTDCLIQGVNSKFACWTHCKFLTKQFVVSRDSSVGIATRPWGWVTRKQTVGIFVSFCLFHIIFFST